MRLKALVGIALMSYTLQSSAALETEADKVSYSLGSILAEQLKQFEGVNADALSKGIKDTLEGKPLELEKQEMFKLIEKARKEQEEKRQKQLQEEAAKNLEKGQAFLKENAKKPGIFTMDNGLQYRIIKEGKGSKPLETSEVTVHYEGKLLDGTVFDSSYERKQPATFKLNQVIRGWTEGLKAMPEGSTWELFIPSDLAYGPGGIPGRIGPNEVLTFKVELIEVKKDEKKDAKKDEKK
ncbi:FKBP-type peptidyl-prolyl cis-trans isomerase [Endozoicomonas euniceicola]|uniref:Peptidyl-prolyl cis-trans isomerase n=1 Tax=Endozoicomonas euniceicola TaxID=1234143 RepID=A0ABY6GYY9_9GAMM|nr:FKBP-type peptidyl-prolyl cis-trans isomerase [Endozoicomonas euniceicola]UYM18008.1 FKBP-type peptidyl-prolyl cis-trans isomerase [Endozoicomonas euniceicola]